MAKTHQKQRVMPPPVWERGFRCHGYWLGNNRVGFVGLTPPMKNPTVYTWSLPSDEALTGQCLSLRNAKRLVERAYAKGIANVT